MKSVGSDQPATVRRLSTTTLVGLVLLRVAIGWHLLYEGLHARKAVLPAQAFSAGKVCLLRVLRGRVVLTRRLVTVR